MQSSAEAVAKKQSEQKIWMTDKSRSEFMLKMMK